MCVAIGSRRGAELTTAMLVALSRRIGPVSLRRKQLSLFPSLTQQLSTFEARRAALLGKNKQKEQDTEAKTDQTNKYDEKSESMHLSQLSFEEAPVLTLYPLMIPAYLDEREPATSSGMINRVQFAGDIFSV